MFNSKLRNINSATKYPSILTYHTIEKGKLLEQVENSDNCYPLEDVNIYVTEKIDGTNSRIIIHGDDYLIGGREELLTAKGDRVINNTNRIAEACKGIADAIVRNAGSCDDLFPKDYVIVLYGESYGSNITKGGKNYSTSGIVDFRLFDVVKIPAETLEMLKNKEDLASVSYWREHELSKYFLSSEDVRKYARAVHIPHVPYLKTIKLSEIPETRKEAKQWLTNFAVSAAPIDSTGAGKSEGVVIRTEDRRYIRKLRFEDYQKSGF